MERDVQEREATFQRTLVDALNRCAHGSWGLFGQNDRALAQAGQRHLLLRYTADARTLIEFGDEIERVRAELGLPAFPLYQRFLDYRRRRDANDLGEPRLAREFLAEIEAAATSAGAPTPSTTLGQDVQGSAAEREPA